MDTLFELLPVLLFLLLAVVNFVRSSKQDDAAPNPRDFGRAGSGKEDEDFDAARRMVEELKRRAKAPTGRKPKFLRRNLASPRNPRARMPRFPPNLPAVSAAPIPRPMRTTAKGLGK